ncbi:transcriptional regulator, SARP family [Labilithrix luteola]|uniref:Transcriptional regulator, SARP family n=1 Tax=Labilithrix luteola TaxID=1391654 RepID=A0A0K1PY83_9BACT|nr:NB-ARC domain-containing protein [Labilithrix luteola]AKU98104.1 transcriptional regulator, SARP family [Labilithrix luteola]
MDAGRDDTLVEVLGRDRDISELRALLIRNRVVQVYGAAGVGKTTLVLEACRSAAAEGQLPPLVAVSMAGASARREAVERIADALGESRPDPSAASLDSLSTMLARAPRTLVWDDLDERSDAVLDMVRRFAMHEGTARIVIVSRRAVTTRDTSLRAPAFQVRPLAREDALRLVHAIEAKRGRSLADDLVEATGGNPFFIRVALAQSSVPRVVADTSAAIRHTMETLSSDAGRQLLGVLAAAKAPLDEEELVRLANKGGRDALDNLRKHLLVERDGEKIGIVEAAIEPAREVLGEPTAEDWGLVAKVAESSLAASARDEVALVSAARAQLELGDPEIALRLIQQHPMARVMVPISVIERLLRDVASRSPAHAPLALRLLAREHLRASDYEAARRTLDEVPRPKTREEAERLALLRAESHIRAGEPEAARHALEALDAIGDGAPKKAGAGKKGPSRNAKAGKVPGESPGLALTRAQLSILRGELEAARVTLEALAPETAGVPQLEARRAVELASSYLYEEDYAQTHAWTTRARAAQKAAGVPIEPVATLLDIHALLGLGEVDRALELVNSEARGRPFAKLFELAALIRRGEHKRALEGADMALALLDRQADILFRCILARDLLRACIGTGDFARAERMLRLLEIGAGEPGLAAFVPICDADRALLAEAEGDFTRARQRIEVAYERIPNSPFIAIDHDVLHGKVPEVDTKTPGVVHAYAMLRKAELLLTTGALEEALESAEAAEHVYARTRLQHELARARLARAEALARLVRDGAEGERAAWAARAADALAGCEDVAQKGGYAPILASAAIVRAALAESRGDLLAFRASLDAAVRLAGEGIDAALTRAATQAGVAVPPRRSTATRRPFEARIERLGVAKNAEVVWRIGPRGYLTAETAEPPERVACVVDLDGRHVRSGARELELPEQRLVLLSVLAEAGDRGITLEEIFARVWGGAFHPLRHRNAVYVALARLKDSLRPFTRDLSIAYHGERYRLSGPHPVAVRRKADREGVRAALGTDE